MYIRRLMGQRVGLKSQLPKTIREELLEGDNKHAGYVDIIDQLTIDETNKLRREVQTLRVEKNSWEELKKEVDGLKELLKRG